MLLLLFSHTSEQPEPVLDLWSVHTKSPVLSWRFPVVHSVTELETFSSPLMPPTTNTYRNASESHSTLKKISS